MIVRYEEIVAEYEWVKENIKYYLPYWGDTARTLSEGRGQCGMKSELLASRLRARGVEVRYVELRPAGVTLPIARLAVFDVHIWLEARVNGDWLTLDPTPDSGIVGLTGDSVPGSHLGRQGTLTRWDEIPHWFKETYNHPLVAPLRWLTNLSLARHRVAARKRESSEASPRHLPEDRPG